MTGWTTYSPSKAFMLQNWRGIKSQCKYGVLGRKFFYIFTQGARSENWMAPWKNRISSTTMKLRKSLIKPVTQQNISSCLVLPPEIVMHDEFNVFLWTSADICVFVQDDLGWKNRTTRYIFCHVTGCTSDFHPIRRKYLQIYASGMTISGERTEQHIVVGFGELAAVD